MVFPTRTACTYPYAFSQGTPKYATSRLFLLSCTFMGYLRSLAGCDCGPLPSSCSNDADRGRRSSGSVSDPKHDLSALVWSAFEHLVGEAGLGEWQDFSHARNELATLDERGDAFEARRRDVHEEEQGTHATPGGLLLVRLTHGRHQ